MESRQKVSQYAYQQNSALVLTTERGRRDHSGAEQMLSVAAKKTPAELMREMGTRAGHTQIKEQSKAKKRALEEEEDPSMRRKKKKGELGAGFAGVSSVLNADVENVYRPQTRETKAVYETLLAFLQQEMGDKPHDVLASAADEVISVLKDPEMNVKEQQSSIESLFATQLSSDRFRQLVNIGQKITDYRPMGVGEEEGQTMNGGEVEKQEEALDENLGVSVVFGEDEEGEEEEEEDHRGRGPREEEEDEDEDDDEGEDADGTAGMDVDGEEGGSGPTFKIERHTASSNKGASSNLLDEDEEELDSELDARTIDAHWIQRQVSTFLKDAHMAHQTAIQILEQLADPQATDAMVENQLVTNILGFEQFTLIKLLLRNRWKIVYCIRLAQCGGDTVEDEKKRNAIKAEMEADPKLRPILINLTKTTTDKGLDLEKTLLRESRKMEAAKAAARQQDMEERDVAMSSGGDKTTDAFWSRRPKALLDLDALSFQGGGHFMSNAECKLPKNSSIINKTGYQEVHIPPLKPHPPVGEEQPVKIADMPSWAQPAFKGMEQLNRVQSRVYSTAMKSPENLLLCAPTGAGKTNVAMLTMLREIGLHQRVDGSFNTDAFKMVYVAPMKSLVQEMVLNFGPRLAPYGINVAELSGDQQLNREQLANTQLIVTTPEKWDIVTRKSHGDRSYISLVKLIIIDEVHLLHDARGATLESIVARTIRQIETTQELIRLVGLSATLPNYEDVAMFLRVKPEKGLFFFDNSYRPVPLQQEYVGITHKKAFKRAQLINEICYDKVIERAGKMQLLVFVHSRKETATTARMLRDKAVAADELGKFVKDEARRELLMAMAEDAKNQQLKELLPYGFAIHHAGMSRADRKLVEELFDAKHIQCLVCTATLAWGVNLPASCIIIKGTQVYDAESGGWKELSMLDIGQMSGRAGRPQYDVMGEAIILTSHKELHYYLSLLNEQLPVESQFIPKLADNLNAEIVLGTVSNVREAVSWLGYTYLYVRMLRKPALYGISAEMAESDPYLEQRRLDLIHSAATLLDKHHLIKYDRRNGSFQVTDLGRVASTYYVTHQSIKVFNEYLKPTLSDIELFRVFALASEFKGISVREEEKIELARLLDKVPIPIKESMEEPSAKVNTLLQAYISRLSMEGYALMADMVYITQSASRIMRALFEIVLKRGWAAAAIKVLNLCKMLDHRMWAAQSPIRQFEGRIPADIIKRLESKDLTFEQLYDLEAPALGELVRFPKMGKELYKCIHQLPRLELQGAVQPITRSTLRVELTLTPDFQFDPAVHGYGEPFWVLVEDVDGEVILHHEYFLLKAKHATQEHTLTFTVPIFDPLPPLYYIRVVSDRWLGSEIVLPMSFRHLLLPDKFSPPTELLDLQPISTTDLAHERWINFFSGRFDHFNPIQTQVFHAVYKKNDNLLVAAPTGSGKTVVAELAIMRQLISNPHHSKIVYIAPLDSLAEEKYKEWKVTFGDQYGINVVLLPGEQGADLKLLTSGTLIISTPEKWDVLSRRWKTRKPIQDVNLMIVDELQLIAGKVGPTLEILVSRMRFMKSQLETDLRIVGLSASVANAKDLGEWLGASNSNIFNFHPSARPVPLEIRVNGFDSTDFQSRTLSMIKPAYSAINALSPNKPVFVFVPNKKFARSIAIDFMTYAAGEDRADRFLKGITREDMQQKLHRLQNSTLRETLCSGIGSLHEHMSLEERSLVEQLYRAGHINVLIIEYPLCWGLGLHCHLSIVLGCQQYDSTQHRYVDISLHEVQAMLGVACRPRVDDKSLGLILCPSSKKEFFKRFLYQPAPVESHLDHSLADSLLAEVITKRIESVQDAVDYLTWSFLYRRLTMNPNYYGLAGTTHRHFSDFLSELVENTLEDLQQAKCITLEEEGGEISALNLGMIATYYYIHYTTVEIFSRSLQKKTKLKGLLEILASASEFDEMPVRPKEDEALRKLSRHLPLIATGSGEGFDDPHTKANILLQSHFSRIPLSHSVGRDLAGMLPTATRLLQAMVDVLSSNGWLSPALACMELSQMVTQGLWNNESVLLQLPHFDKSLVERCKVGGVNTIPDLMELEDEDRDQLLQFTPNQLMAVAQVCNAYPDIDVQFAVKDEEEEGLHAGERAVLEVRLLRDPDEDPEEAEELTGVPLVSSTRYPVTKTESWWLVLGNTDTNELISIKKVAMAKREVKVNLEFTPSKEGKVNYMLYLMSADYLGVDQEYEVPLDIKEGREQSDSEEESDDE